MVEKGTGIRVIYFDGTPKGWMCVYDKKGVRYQSNAILLNSLCLPEDFITSTSNQRAEYLALIFALQNVMDYHPHLLIGDCENVILQIEGINQCKDKNLKILKDIADKLISDRGLDVSFEHVLREDNVAGKYLENWLKRREKT